jgi:hypothetical protein
VPGAEKKTESKRREALAEAARLLGLQGPQALGALTPSSLVARPIAELAAVATALGVPAGRRAGKTSRPEEIKKDALLARIWKALEDAGCFGVAPRLSTEVTTQAPTAPRSRARRAAGAKAALPPPSAAPSAGAPAASVDEPAAEISSGAALTHKFEVGAPPPGPAPGQIPWSYGRDRVTAMPVDPDRLYVYWEVTDEAMAAARAGLGQGGAGAWLDLRVYDVTGRIFDGTNAWSYFDHEIERDQRQWFFLVGKPTSELIVEIGMRSHEGYFVRIARSSRVEFPRKEPAPWSEPEWLTVRAPAHRGDFAGRGGRVEPRAEPPPPAPAHVSAEHVYEVHEVAREVAVAGDLSESDALSLQEVVLALEGGQVPARGEITWEVLATELLEEAVAPLPAGQGPWQGPLVHTSWTAGPFEHPVEAPVPSATTWQGVRRVLRAGGRVHVVEAPWQVVIRGLGARRGRQVIGRWQVFRSWLTDGGRPRGLTWAGGAGAGMGARGASDRLVAGSELRLLGASERYFLGASELRLGGASELAQMGASELRLGGASEWQHGQGSEVRLGGASERVALGGGSEPRFDPPPLPASSVWEVE